MPFEAPIVGRKRIAVVGGGISGMGAAYTLSSAHNVTLFEAEPRLGGHARTVVAGSKGDRPVDTGFIVFNYGTYPYLTALFDELDVPVTLSNMSFGASIDGGRLEYGLANLSAVFAQRRNSANPSFLRMIRDILYFNKNALRIANENRTRTVGQFLNVLGTGQWFRDYYLLPLTGAIWSTPTERIMDFPAHAMMQFMENHALLQNSDQHQWYTVDGGSTQYVRRLEDAMIRNGTNIRCKAAVQAIRRAPGLVHLKTWGGEWETFDEVVLATHSDDSLGMLADPTPQERAALGSVSYQPNDIVLHADTSIMPKRKQVWSSWVYTEDKNAQSDRIDLTYWMNSLQPIPHDDPHFVTLNTKRSIREELVYDQVTLRHPVYDLEALAAQDLVRAFNGANGTWFCGAWMRHGFHEDGLTSGIDVADAILRTPRMAVAAE